MYSKIGFNICILLFFALNLHAQDHQSNPPAASELKEVVHLHGEPGIKGKHRLTLELAHTGVSQGLKDGDRKWITLPSWAVNYDYWLSNKLGIGVHTDFILENFKVEEGGGNEIIERDRPVAPAAVVLYKISKHASFLAGAGAEFASSGTLFLNRFGFEMGWEVGHKWEVGGTLAYDIRWNAYDSWTLSFGVSRVFGGKRK
jgi:hypothetical protein